MTRRPAPGAETEALDPSQLFSRLAARRGLILAVSGGPDSTALMVLMSEWRERPSVLVVSVDHGLRPEAADEVRLVAENSARLGLPWRTMKAPERGSGNLQDWARRARYRLLADAAGEAGFDTIVTAHHQDDQAETFLLRLARGSGVYGLAAMPEEGSVGGIDLVRPLLHVPRETLAAVAARSGLPVVADASNLDLRFDRVRLRALMPALAEHGLTAARLAETAGRLARAATALDHYAVAFLREHFAVDCFGAVRGPAAAFDAVPEEVGLRALALVLKGVGGAEYTPRLEAVEPLRLAIMAAGSGEALKRTLGGVVIAVAKGRVTAQREWGRAGVPDSAAPAGATLLWDGRFQVEIPRLGGALSVGALARSKRRLRAVSAARAAVGTLPGLYRDGTLIAVPDAVSVDDDGLPLGRLEVACVVAGRLGIRPSPPLSAA